MDPNATLARIRELVAQLRDPEQIDCAEHAQEVGEELAAAFVDLDGWLSRDGFPPRAWITEDRQPLPRLGEPDPRRCRACGTTSAECDAIYERTEMTTGDLCCRLCQVADTSALHDPSLPSIPAAIDGQDVVDFQDEGNGEVTLDLADGSVFTFRVPAGEDPFREEASS